MPYLRLKWHFTDAFQNKISLPDYYFSLSAKKTSVLSGTISNGYYGKFHLQANKVRIYSFTHLLSLPVACKAKADILFYPSPFVIPIQLSEGIRFFSAECDGFEEIISGTGSYHTSDIREFLPGDKLRQIHWKLSARTDQLLVKETGRPKGFPVLLFLEKGKSDKKASPSQYSTFCNMRPLFLTLSCIMAAIILLYGTTKKNMPFFVSLFKMRKITFLFCINYCMKPLQLQKKTCILCIPTPILVILILQRFF